MSNRPINPLFKNQLLKQVFVDWMKGEGAMKHFKAASVMDSINQHVKGKYMNKPQITITPHDFLMILKDTTRILTALTKTKGQEYTQGSDDKLANFKRNAAAAQTHPLTAWRIYFGKHLDSIQNWMNDVVSSKEEGQYSEPITGRIDDAILYLVLLKAFYYERHQEQFDKMIEMLNHPTAEAAAGQNILHGREPSKVTMDGLVRSYKLAREAIFTAISKERDFQDDKYGPVNIAGGRDPDIMRQGPGGHELAAWTLIIEKELEEAKDAAMHGGHQQTMGRNSIRSELIQVAAVCVAALEQHGTEE